MRDGQAGGQGARREGGQDAAAGHPSARETLEAARRLEAAVPHDVEAGDPEAFDAAAHRVMPVAEAALAAGAPADPALLAAARIAAHRALRGEPGSAVELLTPAAALAERATLENPFLAAVLSDQLASALQDLGRESEARAAAGRAEAIARRTCRADDPRLAVMLTNVGMVFKRGGDFLTAEVHFRRALEALDHSTRLHPSGAEATAGPHTSSPGSSSSINPSNRPTPTETAALSGPICLSLCDVLRAQGRPAEARPLAERAVREAEAALGPMHPVTADALESLALALDEAGEREVAGPLWSRVAAVYEWNLGPDHPVTRAARDRL